MSSKKPSPGKCGARLRKSHPPRYCQRYPMPNGRCYLHGGKSLKGLASPTYKGKGYSRYFPRKKLAEIYARSYDDPELTRLRKDLALVETRLVELIQSLNSQQNGSLWTQLRSKHRELKRSKPTSTKAANLFKEIGELVERGSNDSLIWNEIAKQIDLRRRLLDSETKRVLVAHQVMTAEEVRLLIDAVANLIREHVKDRQALQKISEGLVGFIDVEAKILT